MNRCPECRSPVAGDWCTNCGFRAASIDGFVAFAPQLAREAPGFEPSHFKTLAQLEAGNFWFKARNDLILAAFEQFCGNSRKYLEIGCGTGHVLSAICSKFPDLSCWGSEIFVEGLSFAASRVPGANLFQMDARQIPFVEHFDTVGAFDVLEHIEDDVGVIRNIRDALVPGGHLIATVPQHQWLWSAQDEMAHHVRRYARGELEQKLEQNGFRLLRSHSFVSLLLPALILSRLTNRGAARDPFAEFRISPWLNTAMLRVMQAEHWLIRTGIRFPVGGSRLVVAART